MPRMTRGKNVERVYRTLARQAALRDEEVWEMVHDTDVFEAFNIQTLWLMRDDVEWAITQNVRRNWK